MVKINRVYTRTGDDGTTGLVGGSRIGKDSLRISACGDVDELNSYLGIIRTLLEKQKVPALADKLPILQNELFDVGAEVAAPLEAQWEAMPRANAKQAERLERWIDELNEKLPELRSFVLPGGTDLNANLHVARAVCRRAERSVIALSRTEKISEAVLIYLNRLSDLLFVMARYAAMAAGAKEYLWEPGATSKAK